MLALATIVGLVVTVSPVTGQQRGQVVISTYGGSFVAAQRRAYFEPFERETGIHVVVTGEPEIAKVKAMVENKNTEWDAAEFTMAGMFVMQQQNLLAPIDYSGFSKAELATMIPEVVTKYGIGTLVFGDVIAYNTKAYSAATAPKTWAEFWDTSRFPGKRSILAMDYDPAPLEVALLADGVSPKNLYPLDVDRAFKSLERIRPQILKWGGTGGVDAISLLATGEVSLSMASTGNVNNMIAQGGPVGDIINQGLLYTDVWVIPRGAKNYQNALRFLQFASAARNQAVMAAIYPNGPANRGAYRYLTPEIAAKLPTSPQNLPKMILVNAKWWSETDASGKTNAQRVADVWHQWILHH
jgi:putative spermidine/putrescine transport system substrate-binding protein